MNHIINDYGQTVIAVGAPGSIARVTVEYPKLINRLNSLWLSSYSTSTRCIDEAIEMIRNEGINSTLETNSILQVSHYGNK